MIWICWIDIRMIDSYRQRPSYKTLTQIIKKIVTLPREKYLQKEDNIISMMVLSFFILPRKFMKSLKPILSSIGSIVLV